MAVERVFEGENPSDVIASYGMHRTTIYKWIGRSKGKGAGLRTIKVRKGNVVALCAH
jgi:transposase